MFKTKNQGMTLLELIVVVVIIGILATLYIPKYQRSRERAIDKQAQTILVLIRAAERNYKMETGSYYPKLDDSEFDFNNINGNLSLDLIDDGTWDKIEIAHLMVNPSGFIATLDRNKGGFNRQWQITDKDVNATCSGNCP